MKRMNLLVIVALGVTGMLHAKPVDPNDPNQTRYTGQAGYYAYKVLADYGLTAADMPKVDSAYLRARLSKKGQTTQEDYVRALYQEGLSNLARGNYFKALTALWELVSSEALIKAATEAGLFDDRLKQSFVELVKQYSKYSPPTMRHFVELVRQNSTPTTNYTN